MQEPDTKLGKTIYRRSLGLTPQGIHISLLAVPLLFFVIPGLVPRLSGLDFRSKSVAWDGAEALLWIASPLRSSQLTV
jgi:hypothetical protein